ncbi:hypothetical protein ACCO45_000973 [Purpureocillium lilacinum]|uniref:Uncharacterized protein n=1 Tax=Purpureocillium lilacinum TaxID=33203 RepID=A0ACC4E753_PURLI
MPTPSTPSKSSTSTATGEAACRAERASVYITKQFNFIVVVWPAQPSRNAAQPSPHSHEHSQAPQLRRPKVSSRALPVPFVLNFILSIQALMSGNPTWPSGARGQRHRQTAKSSRLVSPSSLRTPTTTSSNAPVRPAGQLTAPPPLCSCNAPPPHPHRRPRGAPARAARPLQQRPRPRPEEEEEEEEEEESPTTTSAPRQKTRQHANETETAAGITTTAAGKPAPPAWGEKVPECEPPPPPPPPPPTTRCRASATTPSTARSASSPAGATGPAGASTTGRPSSRALYAYAHARGDKSYRTRWYRNKGGSYPAGPWGAARDGGICAFFEGMKGGAGAGEDVDLMVGLMSDWHCGCARYLDKLGGVVIDYVEDVKHCNGSCVAG